MKDSVGIKCRGYMKTTRGLAWLIVAAMIGLGISTCVLLAWLLMSAIAAYVWGL